MNQRVTDTEPLGIRDRTGFARLDPKPVIPGFYPDPSGCFVGGTYYLACSSFEYLPGVPIFASRDLQEWTQIGNALDRASQLAWMEPGSSEGVYAPTLRHHDGLFWLITTDSSSGEGHLLVTARDPAGPWSDPITFPTLRGIDPDLAWDEEGNCWLTWAGFQLRSTHSASILQVRVDPSTGEVLSSPQDLWSGTGGQFPEAPHLYHVDDLWYLMIAEGGTERGHAVTIARGPSPSGPFVANPANPILTSRGTDNLVQNTGHGDLVEGPDGRWSMLYLGSRVLGGGHGYHLLGRETFASEITWVDGWPQVGKPIFPSAVKASCTGGSLTLPLGPEWIAPARFPRDLVAADTLGVLLQADHRGLDVVDPVLIAVRQRRLEAKYEAVLDLSKGSGGMTLRLDESHYYATVVEAGRVRVLVRLGPLCQYVGSPVELADQSRVTLTLQTTLEPRGRPTAGPDIVSLGVKTEGKEVSLANLDGRYLSTEVAGGFTGRVVGLFALDGEVRIVALHEQLAEAPQ
jgi:xylan 1,4-beta-xylosidase